MWVLMTAWLVFMWFLLLAIVVNGIIVLIEELSN